MRGKRRGRRRERRRRGTKRGDRSIRRGVTFTCHRRALKRGVRSQQRQHAMYNRIHSRSMVQKPSDYVRCLVLQLDWIVRCLNLLRVFQPRLFPHLVHRLHNHQTLLPSHPRALQLSISQAPCTLIRFPEHA